MKSHNHEQEMLRKLLRQAYYEKEKLEVDVQWQFNVMRRIRNLAQLKSQPNFSQMFEQLVWRLAPVTSTIILVFAIVLLNFDLIPDLEISQLLYNESGVFSLIQFLRL